MIGIQKFFIDGIFHIPMILFLIYILARSNAPNKQNVFASSFASTCRIMCAVILFGVLAGCANSDQLPVAKGPLFQLNAGVWHASSPDLSDPPHVAED